MQLRDRKGRFAKKTSYYGILIIFAVVGLLALVLKAVEFGAVHDVQSPIKEVRTPVLFQKVFPVRPEPEIIRPVIVVEKPAEFTPVEQKIIDKWGYREGAVALAIAKCESGMDQYAVSNAGALGLFQIHWPAHKDKVRAMDKTSAVLLTDVDFNIEIAYTIWENAGGWQDWDVYNSGVYISCL